MSFRKRSTDQTNKLSALVPHVQFVLVLARFTFFTPSLKLPLFTSTFKHRLNINMTFLRAGSVTPVNGG
ncbi:hypothetical protein F2P81_021615 [Scophthalmus maximus]|uniref:Uncharacterized protein n=1 Tax=Scophthalmus maximus TaxID=52904 RepID=A0A6A4S3Y4_SCOMX|nr:hypothetical protein F2P81_021615 [Scophthalmus maximus]